MLQTRLYESEVHFGASCNKLIIFRISQHSQLTLLGIIAITCDCASKLGMWRHLPNAIEWWDKFQCDIWLLSTQNCIGLWPPNSNSADIFVHCIYPFQVSSSCVYSFGSYRVYKHTNTPTNPHTNKQIPVKTSNVLRYATTFGWYKRDLTLSFQQITYSVYIDFYQSVTTLHMHAVM